MFISEQLSISVSNEIFLRPISFKLDKGEILQLIGESGIGKTTILKALLGLLSFPFKVEGNLILNDRDITNIAPENRKIGILFQEGFLFPHMSVAENLLFAVAKNIPKKRRKQFILELLDKSNLKYLLNRAPESLSAGEKMRIALLRVMASQPEVLLLDEPFANLDKNMKHNYADLIQEYIKQRPIPVILVSHDQSLMNVCRKIDVQDHRHTIN